ncbi:hypothetical protein ABPG73_021412 [Tetrahymena malaccensis]
MVSKQQQISAFLSKQERERSQKDAQPLINLLQTIPIFEHYSKEDNMIMMNWANKFQYLRQEKGQQIYARGNIQQQIQVLVIQINQKGSYSDTFYIILSGEVGIFKKASNFVNQEGQEPQRGRLSSQFSKDSNEQKLFMKKWRVKKINQQQTVQQQYQIEVDFQDLLQN